MASLAAMLTFLSVATPAVAGELPTTEFAVGYSFLRVRSLLGCSPAYFAWECAESGTSIPLGWYASITANLNQRVGVKADFGGNYWGTQGASRRGY